MSKPKYKIGDKVIITRRPTKEELSKWCNSWPTYSYCDGTNMDRMIGEVVTIDSSGYISGSIYEYFIKETWQTWPECVMKPQLLPNEQLLLWDL